jgi:drug/metabolite transporter (DMT)-like permease
VAVALWGGVFVAVYELLPVLDAVQIATLRFSLAALLFAALLGGHAAWRPRLTRRQWLVAVAAGLSAVPASQLPLIEGQRYLSPALASLIITTSPAIAAVLGVLFANERLTGRQVVGFALALAGVAVIVVLGAGSGADVRAASPVGAAISALTPISWAAYTLLASRLAADQPVIGVTAVVMVCGGTLLLPAVPHTLAGLGDVSGAGWGWAAFLVVCGSFLPYLLWNSSLRHLPVNRTAAFLYLVPLFAAGWTAVWLGQLPGLLTLVGGAIVVAGVALTQASPRPALARGSARRRA